MSDYAIKIDGLGKKYTIERKIRYRMLRDSLQESATRLMGGRKKQFNEDQLDGSIKGKPHIWALKDVSVEIPKGSSTGIIGSNGAGKTTLLKILAHITVPSKGQVRLRGRVGSLLEVGTGFHPELTGRENIFLNGAILGMRKQEIVRKFDEIVEFSEIEKYLDTPVKFYSSGMAVRLAFSVAAHLDPEIILLDEVLAVGDISFQKKSLNKMGEVAQSGRTILFVSHNLAAVKALCKSAIFLERGELKYFGDVTTAVETYLGSIKGQQAYEFKQKANEKLELQIMSIRVVDQNDVALARIPHDMPFLLKIQIEVRNFANQFFPRVKILDSDFETLICSNHFNQNEDDGICTYAPGMYTFYVKVPALLLVPKDYRISVNLIRKSTRHNHIEDQVEHVCPFEVFDNGSVLAKYGVEWVGKLSFPLEWVCIQES